jgi:hypothetical protein
MANIKSHRASIEDKIAEFATLRERQRVLENRRSELIKMHTQHSSPMRYVKYMRLREPIDNELRKILLKTLFMPLESNWSDA